MTRHKVHKFKSLAVVIWQGTLAGVKDLETALIIVNPKLCLHSAVKLCPGILEGKKMI